MNAPENLLYTKDHEWVELDHENRTLKMGITDFAQDALGDVVFVQTPAVGTQVQLGMSFAEVESSKSVSDIYAAASGTVKQVNEDLTESPQRINEDPYGKGWICIIELSEDASTDHLLPASAYKELVEA